MQKSESSVSFSLKTKKNGPKVQVKNKAQIMKVKVRHEISQLFH